MTIDEIISAIDEIGTDGIGDLAKSSKALQGHIDRRVQNALRTYAERHPEPEQERNTPDPEQAFERKQAIFDAAVERGIDPKLAISLLVDDADDTDRLRRLAEFAAQVGKSTKESILKEHARGPEAGSLSTYLEKPIPAWSEVVQNPDNYDESEQAAALDAELERRQEQKTTRAGIRRRMKG